MPLCSYKKKIFFFMNTSTILGLISTLGGMQWNSLENKPQVDILQILHLSFPHPSPCFLCSSTRFFLFPGQKLVSTQSLCASHFFCLDSYPAPRCSHGWASLVILISVLNISPWRGPPWHSTKSVHPLSPASNNSIASLNFIFLITDIPIPNYLSPVSTSSVF